MGGASALPLVGRLLRERYCRTVRTSPYPHAATAIGLAIAADQEAGYQLRERFTRHFGVWREAEEGRAVAFDVVFAKDSLRRYEARFFARDSLNNDAEMPSVSASVDKRHTAIH